jgi:hypothetical protein
MTILRLFAVASLLLWTACGKGPDIAGSGSESSNALTGTVLVNQNQGGPSLFQPAESTSVYLYRITPTALDSGKVDYTWTLQDSTLSTGTGEFRLNSMKPGNYTLLFQRQSKKTFSGYFQYGPGNSVMDLGYVELNNTENITGSIRDTAASPGLKRWVLNLVGTPYVDTVDYNGGFNFADVPAGFYNFKIGAPVLDSVPMVPYFGLITSINGTSVVDRYNAVYFIWATDSLAVNNNASTISIPWQTNAMSSNMSFGPDTTKLNIDNYRIEYTTTQNP